MGSTEDTFIAGYGIGGKVGLGVSNCHWDMSGTECP